MFLFSIAFNLFTPQSHSFDGQRIVELGMNPRQSHLKRPVWLWSNVHICGQNRISPLLLYQVSHDVEGRQKDLLNPSQRESLAQHLEQIKTLAPILICSMKIFIQILNQVAINLSKLVLFRKTKWLPPFLKILYLWDVVRIEDTFLVFSKGEARWYI